MCLGGSAPCDHRALAPGTTTGKGWGKPSVLWGSCRSRGTVPIPTQGCFKAEPVSTRGLPGAQSAIQARGAQQTESPLHPCTHEGDGRACPELPAAPGKRHDPLPWHSLALCRVVLGPLEGAGFI